MQHFSNFDTHSAVKRLQTAGLTSNIAEEIVTSIALSRDYDLSHLITKEEFFKFKEENSSRFNKIDTEIAIVKQEIAIVKQEMKAEIATSKSDVLKWVIGLFIAQITTTVGLFLTLLLKLYS
jgi:hypothetical protein